MNIVPYEVTRWHWHTSAFATFYIQDTEASCRKLSQFTWLYFVAVSWLSSITLFNFTKTWTKLFWIHIVLILIFKKRYYLTERCSHHLLLISNSEHRVVWAWWCVSLHRKHNRRVSNILLAIWEEADCNFDFSYFSKHLQTKTRRCLHETFTQNRIRELKSKALPYTMIFGLLKVQIEENTALQFNDPIPTFSIWIMMVHTEITRVSSNYLSRFSAFPFLFMSRLRQDRQWYQKSRVLAVETLRYLFVIGLYSHQQWGHQLTLGI